jgi:hypothetical protein
MAAFCPPRHGDLPRRVGLTTDPGAISLPFGKALRLFSGLDGPKIGRRLKSRRDAHKNAPWEG